MLSGLDIFSGIGGITRALAEYVRPIAYCEIDRYARGVLLSRMSDGRLPVAPIWDDITTLQGSMLPEIDIIYGGFPCQDISVAGNGKGLEGERSGLFFEILRLVDEIRPPFIFLENVPAITTRGGIRVTEEITARGYDSRWRTLSAQEVGAPHKRNRWWLLAHTSGSGRQQEPGSAYENEGQNEGRAEKHNNESQCLAQSGLWLSGHDGLHRVDDGLPSRMDRIKALGNAVVPSQARAAFEHLMGLTMPDVEEQEHG